MRPCFAPFCVSVLWVTWIVFSCDCGKGHVRVTSLGRFPPRRSPTRQDLVVCPGSRCVSLETSWVEEGDPARRAIGMLRRAVDVFPPQVKVKEPSWRAVRGDSVWWDSFSGRLASDSFTNRLATVLPKRIYPQAVVMSYPRTYDSGVDFSTQKQVDYFLGYMKSGVCQTASQPDVTTGSCFSRTAGF